MWKIEKVLIASDNLEGMEWALEKAVFVEHYTGASLHALQVIYDYVQEAPSRIVSEEIKKRLVERLVSSEQYALQSNIERINDRVARITAVVKWNKNSAAEILAYAHDEIIDLIIKPVSTHHRIRDYINAPSDWEIMRHAPCPVLISKDQPWPDKKRLLVALDIADERHESLNRALLEAAVTFTGTLDAELHIASVYPDLGQEVNNYQVAVDFVAAKEEMKKSREALLQTWVDSMELTNVTLHVHAGSPARTIVRLAEEIEPCITIVGTAARQGAGKLIFGNTSETLIPQIEGDILCVYDVIPADQQH